MAVSVVPYAFVNALLRVAQARYVEQANTRGSDHDSDGACHSIATPYVQAVRDALLRGGCNASRSAMVGACVAALTVSRGWGEVADDSSATLGGVPLGWVECTWCGGRALELLAELGRVRGAALQRGDDVGAKL